MTAELYSQVGVDAASEVERLFPGLEISRNLTIDELWALFEKSGFLYPAKLRAMEPHASEIRRTNERLVESRPVLMETLVCRRDADLVGHLSLVKAYRHTWMVQHLAALRALGSSAVLNLANAHFVLRRPEMEWLRISFRPENSLPMRAFGEYARQAEDGSTSVIRELHYWTGSLQVHPARNDRIFVERAAELDLPAIRAWLVARGRGAEFEGLEFEDLRLEAIGKEYTANGLERGRTVLVARCANKFAGFAACEFASRGVNLSELTNAATIEANDDDTREALLREMRAFYSARGTQRMVVLDDGGGARVLTQAGFVHERTYAVWTFHRRKVEGALNHFESLFARVRKKK